MLQDEMLGVSSSLPLRRGQGVSLRATLEGSSALRALAEEDCMAMRNPPHPIASMHARRRWRLRRRQSLRPAPPLVVPSTSSRAILCRSAGPLAPITMKLNFQAF